MLVGGVQGEVEVRKLSKTVCKIVVFVDKSSDLDLEKGVEWKLKFGSDEVDLRSRFVVVE